MAASPAGSVVVSGNLPSKDGTYSLYCAVIVKQVDAKTLGKVGINEVTSRYLIMILYGIKNCDTVKKARRWLEANDVAFDFHDFRADGLDQATIESWLQTVSWEVLLNKTRYGLGVS